jgi:branched-subunit amino acid transport protein
MALVTYIIRSAPLVLVRKKIENVFINSFLYYVPYACLTALTIPSIFYTTDSFISSACGLIVAVILGLRKKSLIVTASLACVTVFVVSWLVSLV